MNSRSTARDLVPFAVGQVIRPAASGYAGLEYRASPGAAVRQSSTSALHEPMSGPAMPQLRCSAPGSGTAASAFHVTTCPGGVGLGSAAHPAVLYACLAPSQKAHADFTRAAEAGKKALLLTVNRIASGRFWTGISAPVAWSAKRRRTAEERSAAELLACGS